jgi:hypothetical protein
MQRNRKTRKLMRYPFAYNQTIIKIGTAFLGGYFKLWTRWLWGFWLLKSEVTLKEHEIAFQYQARHACCDYAYVRKPVYWKWQFQYPERVTVTDEAFKYGVFLRINTGHENAQIANWIVSLNSIFRKSITFLKFKKNWTLTPYICTFLLRNSHFTWLLCYFN